MATVYFTCRLGSLPCLLPNEVVWGRTFLVCLEHASKMWSCDRHNTSSLLTPACMPSKWQCRRCPIEWISCRKCADISALLSADFLVVELMWIVFFACFRSDALRTGRVVSLTVCEYCVRQSLTKSLYQLILFSEHAAVLFDRNGPVFPYCCILSFHFFHSLK